MGKISSEVIEQLLNECESSALDFKAEQYRFISASDEEKSELLKDILAFANALRRTDAYILIGIREVKGSRAIPTGITEDLDDAQIQQFVNSKTQRSVEFSYQTIPYEEVKIGLIYIPIQERPFYLKKDYGKLKKNIVYIRRGTSTGEASPDKIAKMNITYNLQQEYTPTLCLHFPNGTDTEHFEISHFEKVSEEGLRNEMAQYKNLHPKSIPSLDRHPDPLRLELQNILAKFNDPEGYCAYLDACYKQYEKYLRAKLEYENQQKGRIELEMHLTNMGTLPAEDIDLFLHFPDAFDVYSAQQLVEEPKEPKAPMGFAEFCNPLTPRPELLDWGKLIFALNPPSKSASPRNNVSVPKIRRTKSFDVEFNVRKVKHNQSQQLPPLYAVFQSYEKALPFTIDYNIQAANVPHEVHGKLNVVIVKTH